MIKDNTQLTIESLKEILLKEELTIEQFFIMECLKSDKNYLLKYLDSNKHKINITDLIQDLIIKKYITLKNISEDYNLENILIKKTICDEPLVVELKPVDNSFDVKWEEFLSLYPKKSGERPLHNMKSVCKEKYFRYLQQGILHEDIIKGLNAEINLRQRAKQKRQFFPEWKLLSTYINQKGWEQFVELYEINENQEFTVNPDGRVTRIL